MGTSSPCTDNTAQKSPDDSQAKPLPDAYKTFLDSISNKITSYLDDDDQNASRKDSRSRTCATCGHPRNADGRHEKPADGNTSATIQTLTYQLGAAAANLVNGSNATVAVVPWSTNASSVDKPGPLDTPYAAYLAGINDFADAVTRRGKVFHDEENAPVYRALQGLAAGVHGYGLYLRDRSLISRRATISTITAGSYVIQAQSVWANNRNYPGRKRDRRVRRAGGWLEEADQAP